MTDVKICGVTDPSMTRHVAGAGASWIGFVFVPASPRYIQVSQADICLAETGLARAVALVADADDDLIDALKFTGFSTFQLHGSESPKRVAEIKDRTGAEIWKAVGVASPEDLTQAAEFKAADRLLIDAKAPKGASVAGGHGHVFDWSVLTDWQAPKPWILAGGLTVQNVARAITATGTPAVDVSSGVESARGVKDADMVSAFIQAAKEK